MQYVEVRSEDGDAWRLRLGMTALRWIETQTGEPFTALADRLSPPANEDGTPGAPNISLELVSTLVAAALRHENRSVTLEDADEMIDAVGVQETMDAVMEAFALSNLFKGRPGEDAPDASGGTAPKNAGTGTVSSRRRQTSA